MGKPERYYWLAVTPDKYELPLMVTESASELARWLGVETCTVFTQVKTGASGKHSGRKIVKVPREDGEDSE